MHNEADDSPRRCTISATTTSGAKRRGVNPHFHTLALDGVEESSTRIIRLQSGIDGASLTGGAILDVPQLSGGELAMLPIGVRDALRASEHALTILLDDAAEGAFPVAVPFEQLDQSDYEECR